MTGWPNAEPWAQDLPECSRYPSLSCPGECQYILPRDACYHEMDAARTFQREDRDE